MKKGLPIIIILLGLALVGVSIFLTVSKPKESAKEKENKTEEKEDDDEEEKEEEKKVTVVLNDNQQSKLMSFLPLANDYIMIGNDKYSPFRDKYVNVTDMDKNWIVVKAIQSIDADSREECTVELNNINGICDYVVSKKQVSEVIESNYDVNSFELPKEVKNNFLFKCTLSGDVYACSNSGGGYISSNPDIIKYFDLHGDGAIYKYLKADKDSNYVYTYYKYAFVEFVLDKDNVALTEEDITFKLYTSSDKTKEIDKNVLNAKDFYDKASTFSKEIISKYENKMQDYKVTYKVDGENYKLVAVEPIK